MSDPHGHISRECLIPLTILWPQLIYHQEKRKEPGEDSTHSEQRRAKRQTVGDPSRALWIWVEALNARIEVLERYNNKAYVEQSSAFTKESAPRRDNPPPRDESHHSSSCAIPEDHSLLIESIIAASNRLSVMEAKMDISYRDAFINTVENGRCIVRGCTSKATRSDRILRHIRYSKNPEHEVAAIILEQTKCFQCNRRLGSLGGLRSHECTVHKERYESRMDIFKQVLEQHSGKSYGSITSNPPID